MSTDYDFFSTSDPSLQAYSGYGHVNPFLDYTSIFIPRSLKELFLWCEFLFYNSPHIYAALRKFGEIPITDFVYDTENSEQKQRFKTLFESTLYIKTFLAQMTLDKYVYGNAFCSMYQPFVRQLKCTYCHKTTNIGKLEYKYAWKKMQFTYNCMHCGNKVKSFEGDIIDKKLSDEKKIKFIRWDPKFMDVDHNQVSDTSIYYWTIPQVLIDKVRAGNKNTIEHLPKAFLKAISEKENFKFADGAIYHMKIPGPAGIDPQWGFPPLTSTLKLFYYTAILRKANSAIAFDHLVPFRVIHPLPGSGNTDPAISISLSKWQDEFKDQFKRYRKDPLHMMFSPTPVGVTRVGGDGRALLTLGEVQEAERNIMAALGIPQEFLFGGLTKAGMEAVLRMIENQLRPHVDDLNRLVQWVADKSSAFMSWENLKIELVPFRIMEDTTHKQMIFALWQSGKAEGTPLISDTTLADLNKIDIVKERRKIKEETLRNVKEEQEMRLEIQKLQNDLRQQIMARAQSGQGMGYDQQQVIANADMLVQELLQLETGMRKSRLAQLQSEDAVMYAVVIQQLEQAQTTMQAEQRSSAQQGGGGGPV